MRFFALLVLLLNLVACGQSPSNTLRIGTMSGPETDLVVAAQEVAEEQFGLQIKIIEFTDYNLPNEALQEGSLDANVYQHFPYLKAAIKAHGYQLKPIAKTFVYPAGIYSNKVKRLSDLPNKALIAIPNDPSNGTRALLLLEKAGLLRLNHANALISIHDISDNPKQIKIKELDAAQLARALADIDAAVINTNFALPAGLKPMKDAIYREDKDSPYANLIVARKDENKKSQQLRQFVQAFQSEAVKVRAQILFGEAAIPAWE